MIGTGAGAAAYLWGGIYRDFGLSHPNVEMTLRAMISTDASIDFIRLGELDFAFVPLPVESPDTEAILLGVQEALLCAAPNNALVRKKGPLSRDDLLDQRFVLYEKPMAMRWLAEKFFKHLD